MPEESEEKEFPSNSKYSSRPQRPSKKKASEEPEKKVEAVVTGRVITRKKSFWSKVRETFTGDDAHSVGAYIMYDIMIPALKNMISDMVSNGAERMLFGEVAPRSRSRHDTGRTPYRKMFNDNPNNERRRDVSPRSRRSRDFQEIVLEDMGEAQYVLDCLGELISSYGVATVADLYDLVDVSPDFTDEQWGWVTIRGARAVRVRDGYLLDMPRPEPID